MPKCACGVMLHYGTVCYKCRTKNNDGIIEVTKEEADHIRWYKELITRRNSPYTTTEIHTAFDMLWLHMKGHIHPMDKWKFNIERFSDRLKRAFDMGYIPDLYVSFANKVKAEHVEGKGQEMLQALGFIRPSTTEATDIKEECPF